MAQIKVRVKLDQQAFRRMEQTGDIAKAVQRAAGKVRDDARRNITTDGRVDTGRMRQSVASERVTTARQGVFYRVGSALPYAFFQHEGTRDHGPRRAKVLRFKGRGGVFVFTPRVKGVTPSKFLTRALRNLTARDYFP